MFEIEYYEEYMAEYKIKDSGILDGMVKFIIHAKIKILWMIYDVCVVLREWKVKGSEKEVLNGKFHNTRPLGKPRTRWEDFIQRDMSQVLGIGGWRRRQKNGGV
jgi:hypothetical protein